MEADAEMLIPDAQRRRAGTIYLSIQCIVRQCLGTADWRIMRRPRRLLISKASGLRLAIDSSAQEQFRYATTEQVGDYAYAAMSSL
jgi:hypothetical protein